MNDEVKQIEEPLWRLVLNWGCLVYFFGLPALALFYGVTHFQFADASSPNVAKFLSDFHFAVTALLATVAGLNSFDRYKSGNGNVPKAQTANVSHTSNLK